MALVQIDYPVNLSAQADFDKHGNLIEAGLWDKVDKPLLVRDGVIPQGVVLQIGSDVYHATSDTAITGTASDYVEVTPDGDGAATAAYVATLTGVTWNAQYNGYYNAGATSLYLFDEGKALKDAPQITALLSRYVTRTESGDTYIGRDLAVGRNETVGGTLGVTGALSASTVNTGQGNNNLFAMNQNVRTTDAVTHSTVTARGFDTFGGFHRGGGVNDTNLPVGSVVIAFDNSGADLDRNSIHTVSLSGALDNYVIGVVGSVLAGTWRARGRANVSLSARYWLMQRTA